MSLSKFKSFAQEIACLEANESPIPIGPCNLLPNGVHLSKTPRWIRTIRYSGHKYGINDDDSGTL